MESISTLKSYSDFLKSNRKKINTYMNKVLWFCALTGPAIALGIKAGIFGEASYSSCITISVAMIVLGALHLIMLKFLPDSESTSVFALFIMDILMVYMAFSRIDIHMTWFIVPLLSIMFCSNKVFIIVSIINYIAMLISSWITAPQLFAVRTNYPNKLSFFLTEAGGYTIEYLVMMTAAYALGRTTLSYYHELLSSTKTIRDNEKELSSQMEFLNSMADIYDHVCLIDYDNMTTEAFVEGKSLTDKLDLNINPHTKMDLEYIQHIAPDQVDKFLEFTDLSTVRKRLKGRKSISFEYVHMQDGWIRSQFISIDDKRGKPTNTVIYAAQNIDTDKRKEEMLLRISLTDELTGLNNRRCYYKDVAWINEHGMDDDLVLFSIDINGLKPINDRLGHAAGDELIKAAAKVLKRVLGTLGRVYRTGGDEFLAIIHTSAPEMLKKAALLQASVWHGKLISELNFSIGYAAAREYPGSSITELEKESDNMMYDEKELFYKNKGIDRRKNADDSPF